DLSQWEALRGARNAVVTAKKVAFVAKYAGFDDAYFSVLEALRSAAWHQGVRVEIVPIDAELLEKEGVQMLAGVDGVLVPGGYGKRGTEGKILAAQYAREQKIPYLGLCLGMQMMVIEAARNVLGKKEATSEEFEPTSPDLVIHLMAGQKDIVDKGGTNRLGLYPCTLIAGTKTAAAYGKLSIAERHRHRYEFNNQYRKALEGVGMIIAGVNTDLDLVEIVEWRDHPFMVGVQFHPEFLSRPVAPHPLFKSFFHAMFI
nr:CTP synthase [Candidatus Gracilibacteria bacterium]